MDGEEPKIIQIIPAPAGMQAIYDEGGEPASSRILCLGLRDDGQVVAVDFDLDGGFTDATDNANFVKFSLPFVYKSEGEHGR